MRYLLILSLLVLIKPAEAQWSARASMGINFSYKPSLTDYLNRNFAPGNDQLSDFGTSVIFAGEAGYMITEKTELAFELAYNFNSYTYFNITRRELEYDIIMPTLLYSYVINGPGYQFKFGGGAGPRFVTVKQNFSFNTETFNSTGFGIMLRADGNTRLGGSFYANIGADLRYDFNGEPKHGSTYIYNNAEKENVNLNSLSAGIRLGVSFIF